VQEPICNVQLPTDPDEVQRTQAMWQKFVQSAPPSYANSLAVLAQKEVAPTVNEVAGQLQQYKENLSSSLQARISAVERLSVKSKKLFKKLSWEATNSKRRTWRNCPGRSSNSKRICPISHIYRLVSWLSGVSVPLLKREDIESTHHEAPCAFTCTTMERT